MVNALARNIIQKPFRLFLVFFVIVGVTDLLFGRSSLHYFIPSYGGMDEEFFGTIWFCGIMSLILTTIIMVAVRRQFTQLLPWILGAFAAILLCTFTVHDDLTNGFYGQYRSFTDSIYYPIRHMVPYYFPFQAPTEHDYMLFTSTPMFIKASAFIVAPFLAGYSLLYLRKSLRK